MKELKISIITPSFNQGKFIKKCIESVLNQNYANCEHIIVDGASTDNTIDILKQYSHLKWISEADYGQSDALNKALGLATGDIIGWMNADDYYCENIFNTVNTHFVNEKVRWIIGRNYSRFELIGKTIPAAFNPTTHKGLLNGAGGMMRTQAAFFRKDLLDEIGGFEKSLHYVMDYDAWIKMAKISQPLNVDEFYCVCSVHPAQKTNYRNHIDKLPELIKVCMAHKAYGALIKDTFRMIISFIKRRIKILERVALCLMKLFHKFF